MRVSTILSILTLATSVLSAPDLDNDLHVRSAKDCKAVKVIVTILSQHKAPATSFCSSFLSIPVLTKTASSVCFFFSSPVRHVLILAVYIIDLSFWNIYIYLPNISHGVGQISSRQNSISTGKSKQSTDVVQLHHSYKNRYAHICHNLASSSFHRWSEQT